MKQIPSVPGISYEVASIVPTDQGAAVFAKAAQETREHSCRWRMGIEMGTFLSDTCYKKTGWY